MSELLTKLKLEKQNEFLLITLPKLLLLDLLQELLVIFVPSFIHTLLVSAHLLGIHNAISMLNSRVKMLSTYLEAVKSGLLKFSIDLFFQGKLPKEQGTLRKIASLCHQLPITDTQDFSTDFVTVNW